MHLYELTNDFVELFDKFEEIFNYEPDTNADGQSIDCNGDIIENVEAYKNKMLTAWYDTLEGIEGEYEQKAESIAVLIKQLESEAKILKDEKAAIAKRQSQKEKSVENLKNYLLRTMQTLGRNKVDMPKAVISIRKTAPSLVIDDEMSFIAWAQKNNNALLKYSMPEIRKNDVKALYKNNQDIPFIHLESKPSLNIK
ncbi:MAG: siphovirus Gp157 family protein [Ruminococcus sp.]|nr:siphovirus Gp157 family protein [Ruminococcus sp.]